MDDKNVTLLSCGRIDDDIYRGDAKYAIKTLDLEEGEKLVGVKSGGRGRKCVWHYDF